MNNEYFSLYKGNAGNPIALQWKKGEGRRAYNADSTDETF